MMSISIPYLSDACLRRAAAEFLANYHNPCTIPVPIERIVEFSLGIDIIPNPGMHRSYDIDSMLSLDMQQVCVDGAVFENFPARYRFSLAHEIGHRQLHAEVYCQLEFSEIGAWKEFICNEVGEKDYGKLEYQAYTFAGLVLVPPELLHKQLRAAIAMAESRGMTIQADSDLARDAIEGYLSKQFVVSRDVIRRRIGYDKLWDDVLR
jgi:hypothetical protein